MDEPRARAYQHRVSVCTGCGGPINTTSDPHDHGMPRPADLTMCITCGALMFFDRELRLHPVTPEILETLPPKTVEELREQQERWRARQGKAPIISLPPRSH